MTVEKVQYTAKIHTTGGRDGAFHSDDGRAKN
jgi:organic hydroperoxide reductase OsmC/OhrA